MIEKAPKDGAISAVQTSGASAEALAAVSLQVKIFKQESQSAACRLHINVHATEMGENQWKTPPVLSDIFPPSAA